MSEAIDKDANEYSSIIETVISEAKKMGATASEVSLGIETGLSVSARMGEVETLEYNHDKGLGITVYKGGHKGSASTSDFALDAVRDSVKAACRIAEYTAEDNCAGLADKELMAWDYPDLNLSHPWDIDSNSAVDLALECEDAGRYFDKRITNSEGASVSSHGGLHVYGNSHGFIGSYPTTRHSVSCSVIGQDGDVMQRDYWYSVSRDANHLQAAKAIGEESARRTLARLNGRRIATNKYPVIFSADVASGLIGHFIAAIKGGSLYRKTSFLLDAIDTQVFPEWFNAYEDPHMQQGLASAPYDSEGVATNSREFVKDGILKSYILSSYSARRLGLQTTGNAGGLHNLMIKTGDKSLADLIKTMHKGLLVTELMGQGVNSITGDYSRGAAGFWVDHGEIQYPVEEITIAGNLKTMFSTMAEIGKDVDERKNIKTGSILLDEMTVAGE